MDYYKLFNKKYNRVIQNKSKLYKQLLITSKAKHKAYDNIASGAMKELFHEKSIILENFNDDFNSLKSIYRNRADYYEVDIEELIIKNELFDEFNNGTISNEIDYEEFIKQFSYFLALEESSRIINNSRSLFSFIYKEKIIEQEYMFDSNDYNVRSVFKTLYKKYYPEPELESNTKISLDREYTYSDIKFSVREFAWYMRVLNSYYKWDKNFKQLYEYAIEKYNDPFNDIGVTIYKNSTLYGYIKDDNPTEGSKFKYSSCYMKIFLISEQDNDSKLMAFISKKLKSHL